MGDELMQLWDEFRDQVTQLMYENLKIDAFTGISKTDIYIVVPSMNYRYSYTLKDFFKDVYQCKFSPKAVYEGFEKDFRKYVINNALKSIFKEESL